MSKSAYQAKIAVANYFEMIFFSIPQTLSLYFTYEAYFTTYWESVLFQIFLTIFIAGISTVHISLFISTLLSPQSAQNVGSISILLLGFLYFGATTFGKLPIFIVISLHPPAALALAINSLLPVDQTQINWDGYTNLFGMLIILISGIFYLGLYLYRERERDVDLNDSKTRQMTRIKHSEDKISLISSFKSDASSNDTQQSELRNLSSAKYYESTPEGSYVKTIEAIELTKVYDGIAAVNEISFAIYEEEIFCLLGHNGAGKTTLVNMLTGLIPRTQGILLYNRQEVHNLDKIRGQVGFCPQKDFLLMENTVYENLSFFAEIKKVPDEERESEIERIMNKLGLAQFKDMPAKNLSGGFKRKLNVGIALLNDPKIIIMDEPTSGMDPVSRRNFWNIIKGLRDEKKTVVLTTQFLDEAEELADRIAIMTQGNDLAIRKLYIKGKLFALGKLEFIKNKFGAEYKLVLHNRNHDSNIQAKCLEITSKIQSVIPSALQDFTAAPDVLLFTLPLSERSKFSTLFSELEDMEDIQFKLSLQMVSLEETFVNLDSYSDRASLNEKSTKIPESDENIPSSFLRRKMPTFKEQLTSVLTIKLYKFLKNKALIFYSFFPILFMIGGIIIGSNNEDKKAGAQLIITMLLTGNSFLMHAFCYPPAMERITRITFSNFLSNTLKVMGLRPFPYWLGNIIVDLFLKFSMCLALIICIYAVYIFPSGPDFLQDSLWSFFGLYMAFSFHMIVLTYNLSFSSNNLNTLMGMAPSLFIAGFALPGLVNKILSNFNINGLTFYYGLSLLFFGPAMTLQLGIQGLVPPDYADPNAIKYGLFEHTSSYTGLSLVLGILLFMKVIYTDSKTFELKEKKVYKEIELQPSSFPIEANVADEKQRLTLINNKDPIKVTNVQKVYPNGFKALHDVSFGVEEGQVFCLLGPNGAGKTTAFDIITATIPKTQGTIQLNGQELSRRAHEIFDEIGICPQLNTLWDLLTPRQHLEIYARLKGMKGVEIDEAINYLVKALHFEEYLDKDVEKLSGGNKRKLCVAISMIGAPKLIFLDEPSTGMDPVARSHLWALIKSIMKKRKGAIVLTTHYMQEAELVSDKLGILVNGRFVTIGKTSELKKNFGEYSIVINKLAQELHKSDLERLIKSVLPEANMQTVLENNERVMFKAPAKSMKFANVFRVLEKLEVEGKIKSFSIYTTTLEQIFIKFAKNQIKSDGH